MFKRDFAWHPYLFALFPILYLYAANTHQVALGEISIPILAVMITVAILTTALNLIIKDIRKTSLIMTVGLIWFFSWGHILQLGDDLVSTVTDPVNTDDNLALLILSGMSLGLVSFFMYRSKKSPIRLTQLANLLGLVLVVFQVCTAGWVLISRSTIADKRQNLSVKAIDKSKQPDIYYLLVDGYARSDILAELFNFDNQPFITHLRDRGFYVADQSNSNYSQTLLSLASSLNVNLIEEIATIHPTSRDRPGFKILIDNNLVFKTFKTNGYQILSFVSGYNMIDFDDVDLLRTWYHLSEFGGRLLETTPLRYFIASLTSPYAIARNRLEYTLAKLTDLPQTGKPRFIFAHILCPHPPFMYDSTGAYLEPPRSYDLADGSHYYAQGGTIEEYRDGYTQQIKHLNSRLTKVIDEILDANRDNPPVILLQADHGSGLQLDWGSVENSNVRERMGILNAYYLPHIKDYSALYPSITPANSFRIVLNECFGTKLPLVPDRSYFSEWDEPFRFYDVTEQVSNPDE